MSVTGPLNLVGALFFRSDIALTRWVPLTPGG